MIGYQTILDGYCADYRNTPKDQWPTLQASHTYRELSKAAVDITRPMLPPHHTLGLAYYAGGAAYRICCKRGIPLDQDLSQRILLTIWERIGQADYSQSNGETWSYTVIHGIFQTAFNPEFRRVYDDNGIRNALYPQDSIVTHPYITPVAQNKLANEIIRLAIDQPDYILSRVKIAKKHRRGGRSVLSAIIMYLIEDRGIGRATVYNAANYAKEAVLC